MNQASLRAALAAAALLGLPAVSAQAQTDAERVAKNKQTVLSRVEREPVTFRGDKPGQMRVKWEWYDKVVGNYLYEKQALVTELSAGEKFELRPRWIYKDMGMTFQDILALGPEHDDKLLPILSHAGVLQAMPAASMVGVTLLGKQGEVKGPCIRKYKRRDAYGTHEQLEYRDKDGKLQTAGGLSYDAFTVRWKDIKDKVADDMSEAKATEDLKMERDAMFPEGQAN